MRYLAAILSLALASCNSTGVVVTSPDGTRTVAHLGNLLNKSDYDHGRIVLADGTVIERAIQGQNSEQLLHTLQNIYAAKLVSEYFINQQNADKAVELGGQGVEKANIAAGVERAEIATRVPLAELEVVP